MQEEALVLEDYNIDILVSVTVLLDLVKCFERVQLKYVWYWCCLLEGAQATPQGDPAGIFVHMQVGRGWILFS